MNLKRLISLLSGITLIGTSTTLLSNNINTVNNSIQSNSLEKQYPSIDNLENFEEISSKIESIKDGQNFYKFGLGNITIGLNNETLKFVNDNIETGINALVFAATWAAPNWATVFNILGKISLWQWNWWNPTSYDQGYGVIIKAYGPVISNVSTQ